ncbi:MAG: hypothetical protein ACOVOD_07820 [Rhodoferax sp.]
MLDHPTNQAAGLLDLAISPYPKLVAMVSHGDEQVELPLLLQLCNALVGFGNPVTVLDGTVLETPENPGLAQLLDYSMASSIGTDAPSWSILPARLGLQTLASGRTTGLHSLADTGNLFCQDSVVLVYSTAQTLAQLLRGSRVRPVLAVSNAKTSLLTSYLALKRLLLKGTLEPTIVNVVDNMQAPTLHDPNRMPNSLTDCAKFFLNYQVNALNVSVTNADERPSASIGRLALSLLENALPLQSTWSPANRPYAPLVRHLQHTGAH